MVSSRCFTLQTTSGDIDALVPIADMLNHARPRETAYRVVEQEEAGGGSRAEGGTASFEMRMLQPMARGCAVHDTYGAKGNAQLLATYGFTTLVNFEPDGSSNDVLPLPLPAAGEDEASRGRRGSLVPGSDGGAAWDRADELRVQPAHQGARRVSCARPRCMGASNGRPVRDRRPSVVAGRRPRGESPEALSKRLGATLGGYALNDDRHLGAQRRPPRIPSGGGEHMAEVAAAAAGALILSERTTLRFYAQIVGLCLGVLSPSGWRSRRQDGRRAAAVQLRDEVEAARDRAAAAMPGAAAAERTVSARVKALKGHASRDLAAGVALAYVRVRWPALLQKKRAAEQQQQPRVGESDRKRRRRSS